MSELLLQKINPHLLTNQNPSSSSYLLLTDHKKKKKRLSKLPEEHEDSSWHQEDLIAGDELENVLLIGRELVQEVPNEQQTVRPHRLEDVNKQQSEKE